jgi:hypothetical protein
VLTHDISNAASGALLKRIAVPSQVLAGAGPAVAAVPLVVVWAGGSAVRVPSENGSHFCVLRGWCTAVSLPAPPPTTQRSLTQLADPGF